MSQGDEETLDRAAFAERVGITVSTLSRWVAEGVVTPTRVRRSSYWAQAFSPTDVPKARAVRKTQIRFKGQLTLRQAVEIVEGNVGGPPLPKAPQDSL